MILPGIAVGAVCNPVRSIGVPTRRRKIRTFFRRICNEANRLDKSLPFDIIFTDKKVDSPGSQLADLLARRVGLNVLRPGQENRALEVLERKFFCSGGREYLGEGYENWSMKLFPPSEGGRPQ